MATTSSLPDDLPVKGRQPKPAEAQSSSSSEHHPPTDTLRISALCWVGEPTAWDADGGKPEEYGHYVDAVRSVPLTAAGWSDEHGAFIFKPLPGRTIQFSHRRSTYIGSENSNMTYYGGRVYGEANEQDPLLLVHRSNSFSAFRATYSPPHWSAIDEDYTGPKRLSHPPFVHQTQADAQTVAIKPSMPTRAKIISLSLPDLEMHRAALEDGIGAESEDEDEENPDLEVDGIDYTGVEYWHGDWTRQFIHDARSGNALAPLEKPVMWDAAHAWGVRVRLEPVRNSVKVDRITYFDDDDQNPENMAYGGHRKLRLKSYQNRATILEVYVTPTFFEEPQEEIDSPNSEEDEALRG